MPTWPLWHYSGAALQHLAEMGLSAVDKRGGGKRLLRSLARRGRRALQLSTGGLAAILATGRAPAFAQETTIHWVRGSDDVPVPDQLIKTKLNEQAQKDLGLKINLEGVDG